MDNGERAGDYSQGDEIPVHIIVDDLEAYFDDIAHDYCSRTGGTERTAKKESELVELSKMLHIYHVGDDETKTPVVYKQPQGAVGTRVEQDRQIRYVQSFRIAANEQLEQLKKEIRGVSSIRRTSSGSELVGLGGILQEKVPDRWVYIDKTFESLKDTIIDSFCRKMEVMDQLSNKTLSEWQQEEEFRSEIEGKVIGNCILSLQQEFEQKLFDQNAQIHGSESVNWLDKLQEISALRQELDSISKTISVFEHGQLISHSSLENVDESCNNKRDGHFHCRLSTNHLSPSALEGDGNHEDADMEFVIRLGLLELIFREALINAKDKFRSLNEKYVNENHIRGTLEMESIENKEALRLEAAENKKLKQEILMLTSKLEEKDKVAQEAADALAVERRKMDSDFSNMFKALEEFGQYKEKMYELHQNLDQRTKELREIDEQRKVLHALILKQQDALTLLEAREMEMRKQMVSTIVLARELLTAVSDFESRVNKDISRNCLRVESMSSAFHCLIKKANTLKTNGLLYKQRLETSSSNLEKAEAEVDLLANEVDTLLGFVDEIYKKLDHYSPILLHYPGITETLELVRKKLIEVSRISV